MCKQLCIAVFLIVQATLLCRLFYALEPPVTAVTAARGAVLSSLYLPSQCGLTLVI